MTRGFTFYTNYESRKARELAARPQAALLFFWPELERQVRIEGAIEKVDEADGRRLLGEPAAAVADRRLGVAAERADSRTARNSRRDSRKPTRAFPAMPCRARRTGAAIASSPTRSNSGRAARRGCTTGIAYRRDAAAWRIGRLAP